MFGFLGSTENKRKQNQTKASRNARSNFFSCVCMAPMLSNGLNPGGRDCTHDVHGGASRVHPPHPKRKDEPPSLPTPPQRRIGKGAPVLGSGAQTPTRTHARTHTHTHTRTPHAHAHTTHTHTHPHKTPTPAENTGSAPYAAPTTSAQGSGWLDPPSLLAEFLVFYKEIL